MGCHFQAFRKLLYMEDVLPHLDASIPFMEQVSSKVRLLAVAEKWPIRFPRFVPRGVSV